MILQMADPATISSDFFAPPDSAEKLPDVFVGGWSAARDYVAYRPSKAPTAKPDEIANGRRPDIFVPRVGLRNKLSALRARQRLNRAFRRHQREFEHAMDAVAHDPAGQRELQSIWTSRR